MGGGAAHQHILFFDIFGVSWVVCVPSPPPPPHHFWLVVTVYDYTTVFITIGCMIIIGKLPRWFVLCFTHTLCLDGERFYSWRVWGETRREQQNKNSVNIVRAFTFREVCSPASSSYRATYEVLTFRLNALRYRSIQSYFITGALGSPPPTIQSLSICAFCGRFVVCMVILCQLSCAGNASYYLCQFQKGVYSYSIDILLPTPNRRYMCI